MITVVIEFILVLLKRSIDFQFCHVVYHGMVSTDVCLAPSSVTILSTWWRNGVISSRPLLRRFVDMEFRDFVADFIGGGLGGGYATWD